MKKMNERKLHIIVVRTAMFEENQKRLTNGRHSPVPQDESNKLVRIAGSNVCESVQYKYCGNDCYETFTLGSS
jgi:hypothetical protein